VDELAFQLKDSGARALITTLEYLPNARAACRKVGIPDELIALAGDARDPEARVKHFTSIRNISGASRYRKTKVAANDLAFLVYSSGTTGKPKGVMLSHRNIVANVLQTTYNESPLSWKGGPTNEGDKILAFLPFFHIYGMSDLDFIYSAPYQPYIQA
jgi:long-subunit acyl-CoA synthetase (AMP-forming)